MKIKATIILNKDERDWLSSQKRKLEFEFDKNFTWIEFFKYHIKKKGGKKQ